MMFKYALYSLNLLTREDFSALEILNPKLLSAHPKRQAGFLAARKALQMLVPQAKLPELKLNEFHFLSDYPERLFSLAHTKDLAIAVMADKKDFRSVGVDLEFLDREVKTGSEKYFINNQDEKNLSELELWCAKEAAFKAASFLYSKNLVLKDFWIKKEVFGHMENSGKTLGEIKFFRLENILVSVALLKN